MPRVLEVTLAVMAWILINTLPALAIAWCMWDIVKDAFEGDDKMTNLYGDEYDEVPSGKKNSTEFDRKKRRWENGFQKWSDKMAQEGYTHYGSCGFGEICDYCDNNTYGRPCVRALNELCRKRRLKIDYDDPDYAFYFDGGKEQPVEGQMTIIETENEK